MGRGNHYVYIKVLPLCLTVPVSRKINKATITKLHLYEIDWKYTHKLLQKSCHSSVQSL